MCNGRCIVFYLHFFVLFNAMSSLVLQEVWLKTVMVATFSLSPLLIDCPLSNVENPKISTSWFLHLFGSTLEATGKQIGCTLKPKSMAGSVGEKIINVMQCQ